MINETLNQLAFGWFPYFAVTVLVVGSILRFDKDQYGWRSQSSQFLRRRQMRLGSNLLHIGVLVLLVGHFVGLLTPINVFDAVGIGHGFKQVMALLVGGIAGIAAFAGASILLHRRLIDPRIRRSSSFGDIAVLTLLWLQIGVGLATTFWTVDHLDGEEMVLFMGWAQGILTFDPAAPDLILNAYAVYKLHIVLGLLLFTITPFTRLVHIWSVPVGYVFRQGWQIVRPRNPRRPHGDRPVTKGPVPSTFGGPAASRAIAESGQAGV